MLAPLRGLVAVLACVLALFCAAPATAQTHAPVLERMQERVAEPDPAPRALFARARVSGTAMQAARIRLRVTPGRRAVDGLALQRPARTARELRGGVALITHLRLAAAGAARVPQPRGPPAS